ncbi:MAG: recombinase family protein [Acidimicrobiia bacterium]
MRLIGYVRVSTDLQAERGSGIQEQSESIAGWCAARGYELVGVFRDEGVSGAEGLEGRSGLAAALEAIRSGDAQGVVVRRLDRLARDLVVQEQLLAEVKRCGGRLFSTADGEGAFLEDDADDPSRRLIRHILGAVAEYERSLIVLRLQTARRRKAEAGGYAYGAPPFGFRAQNRELVPDGREQATIERMVTLHRMGASLRDVAATLNAEGRGPKRSATWRPECIARVLTRAGAM